MPKQKLNCRVFNYKSASAKVYFYPNKFACVYEVFSNKKRKGHATGLMKKIVKHATKHGYVLHIEANRYGKKTMPSNDELAKFYERFGFTRLDDQPVFLVRLNPDKK